MIEVVDVNVNLSFQMILDTVHQITTQLSELYPSIYRNA
ncbi:hypothetical protein DFP95_107151 [Cohnella lupini]|uniref:Uncharacterized protein n=1 Tax=Cohnella lupini TaxID=1294267 RepID=A0A3D9IC17_9BACL|nr:hypothetical protein DFP95_107151 [Cohnella lupini]